ncbi:phage baseplate protein [Brucella anthropi]|uniref:phage baseplate protein n=1 Tax=Brucella anthropi TaxID=529 RepID=UPI00235EF5AA|nr:phage baseplate protein [Brucella anthropi]
MHDEIVNAITRLQKSCDDLQRRLSNIILSGEVHEVDGNRVRVMLQPADQRTGKPFLSPWVQVQEASGATGSHLPVAKGDPMRLLSPFGELGAQSIAIRDGYTDSAKSPSQNGELALSYDGCALRFKGGVATIDAREIVFKSSKLTHNDKNVGDTHKHGGVKHGSASTSEPE